MPREWTERHIRELVDSEYKALGGNGDAIDKYIWSLDIPVFAHKDGGAWATLKRLNLSEYELTINFRSYANVKAGETFFFMPNIGLASVTSDVLYIPPLIYFFDGGLTHTITDKSYTNIPEESLTFPSYGLPIWSCSSSLTKNVLRYDERKTGLYCEAVKSFLLTASTPGKIVSKIKLT